MCECERGEHTTWHTRTRSPLTHTLPTHTQKKVLETHGVAVAAYRADDFPAFFARSSGVRAPSR